MGATAPWWTPWATLLVGWMLGAISNFGLELYRNWRYRRVLAKILRAEIELMFHYAIRMLRFCEEYEQDILMTPTGRTKIGRSVYKATLANVATLPESCVRDLVELHQQFDHAELYQAHLSDPEEKPNYPYFLYSCMGALQRAVELCRNLLPSLAQVEGVNMTTRDLEALEERFRSHDLLMGGTLQQISQQFERRKNSRPST